MRQPQTPRKKPQRVSRKPLEPQPPQPNRGQGEPPWETVPEPTRGEREHPLDANLAAKLQAFQEILGDNQDVVFRNLDLNLYGIKAALIYVDGLVDEPQLHDHVLKSLMLDSVQLTSLDQEEGPGLPLLPRGSQALPRLQERLLTVSGAKQVATLEAALLAVLSGDVLLLLDGAPGGLVLSLRAFPTRGLEEPPTESLIRGPRVGFTETLRVNTALVRRYLRDPNLKLLPRQLGRRSRTDIVVAYVAGVVQPKLLAEVQQRLSSIDVDDVLESGTLEQLIEDSWLSPFPQVQYTERPDKLVANLLDGRVAIMVDGTPFALIVPVTFPQYFQSPEDYYERWIIASFLRTLRIGASYLATFTPAIYVAIIAFHPGLLPTKLALAIAATRLGVPFPAVLEALIMELAFELLREAGARLPKPIGQTVSIVGGLIVGDAAVSAGLVSPVMIIVVAMTAIASFALPAYNVGIGFRLLRFPLIVAASVLGLYGVGLGFIVINIHMVSLKSFGTVFLSPLAPYRFGDWKDLLIRGPIRTLRRRPLNTGARQTESASRQKEEGW